MDKIKNSNYITQYKHTYNFIKNLTPDTFKSDEVKLRNILSKDIIPSPIYHEYNGDIKELEEKLKDKSLNSPENKGYKLRLQNDLKKYTVSVHPNHISNYYRALKNGLAIRYDNVHPVGHALHPVVQLNIEQGKLTVNLCEPLAEPCRRLFQHGAESPAFTQISLLSSGQFLILVDTPADTGFCTDIGAQLPVVFLHRLIGKAILHGPLHLEKADMPHLVGQRGQAGSFEELYNELPCPHRNAPGR